MQVERRSNTERQTGEEHVGTYPLVRNNRGKLGLIPDKPLRGKIYRRRIGPRLISLLVRLRLSKDTISSWSERMISHTGTETRPSLLREAAVRNLGQWAQA